MLQARYWLIQGRVVVACVGRVVGEFGGALATDVSRCRLHLLDLSRRQYRSVVRGEQGRFGVDSLVCCTQSATGSSLHASHSVICRSPLTVCVHRLEERMFAIRSSSAVNNMYSPVVVMHIPTVYESLLSAWDHPTYLGFTRAYGYRSYRRSFVQAGCPFLPGQKIAGLRLWFTRSPRQVVVTHLAFCSVARTDR